MIGPRVSVIGAARTPRSGTDVFAPRLVGAPNGIRFAGAVELPAYTLISCVQAFVFGTVIVYGVAATCWAIVISAVSFPWLKDSVWLVQLKSGLVDVAARLESV